MTATAAFLSRGEKATPRLATSCRKFTPEKRSRGLQPVGVRTIYFPRAISRNSLYLKEKLTWYSAIPGPGFIKDLT